MDLQSEFKSHERECRRMAAASRDPNGRATWNQLAERWFRAAENQAQIEQQAQTARRARRPRHVRQHGWFDAVVS
jgi:DNA primase